MLCQEGPFVIQPNGFAVLKFDATSSSKVVGLLYAPPESTEFQKIDGKQESSLPIKTNRTRYCLHSMQYRDFNTLEKSITALKHKIIVLHMP